MIKKETLNTSIFPLIFLFLFASCTQNTGKAGENTSISDSLNASAENEKPIEEPIVETHVDSVLYRSQVLALINGDTTGKWPVKDQPIPLAGAILPNKRIIAYYGNLYSTRMGILGEHPPEKMLAHLDEEIKKWNEADSTIEAVPALHYIAVVAQGSAGKDGMYRSRMPDKQIDSVLSIAKMRNALVFLD